MNQIVIVTSSIALMGSAFQKVGNVIIWMNVETTQTKKFVPKLILRQLLPFNLVLTIISSVFRASPSFTLAFQNL